MEIQSSTSYDSLFRANESRVEAANEAKTYPHPPASPLAVPSEMARAQVNQASMYPALMSPSSDGLFTIGSVTVRPAGAGMIQSGAGFSSWGF